MSGEKSVLEKIMESFEKIFECAGTVTDATDAIANGEIPEVELPEGGEEEGGEENPKRGKK
jgi:hypothetical protein